MADKDGEEEQEFHGLGGNWSRGEYFAIKGKKLREQMADSVLRAEDLLAHDIETLKQDSQGGEKHGAGLHSALSQGRAAIELPIFAGVAVFINGFTKPSRTELRDILVRHGGRFEQYPSPAVTHIVATAMPPSTIKRLKATDQVAKPDWITESLKAGCLLNWRDFALLPSQRTSAGLQALLGKRAAPDTPLGSHQPPRGNPGPSSTSASSVADKAEASAAARQEDEEDEEEAPERQREEAPRGKLDLDCTHPDFIRKYFDASRLHHLSHWRTSIQERLTRRIAGGGMRPAAPVLPGTERLIFHVDMDCFFASVSAMCHPELEGEPIAVCHSTNAAQGSADVASVNYKAREFGVRNGTWLGRAMKLCPQLKVVGYEFDKYEEVSNQMYAIFLERASMIQAVSCDEALLDMTGCADPEAEGEEIRRLIRERTKCNASVGIGPNILLARLATKKAKPDGLYRITLATAQQFVSSLPVRDLPGIGHRTAAKLETLGVTKGEELLHFKESELQALFGPKTGTMLWEFARGVDGRQLQNAMRKSIGADVNWGIRMSTEPQLCGFMHGLAKEVASRLAESAAKTRMLLLKILLRRPDQPKTPSKFLGTGICRKLNRSARLPQATRDPKVLERHCFMLFKQLQRDDATKQMDDITDLRGIGLHAQSLVRDTEDDTGRKISAKRKNRQKMPTYARMQTLTQIFKPQVKRVTKEVAPAGGAEPRKAEKKEEKRKKGEAPSVRELTNGYVDMFKKHQPPPAPKRALFRRTYTDLQPAHMDELDPEVLEALPEDVRKELERNYGRGKKKEELAKKKGNVLQALKAMPKARQHHALYDWGKIDQDVFESLPDDVKEDVLKHTRGTQEADPDVIFVSQSQVSQEDGEDMEASVEEVSRWPWERPGAETFDRWLLLEWLAVTSPQEGEGQVGEYCEELLAQEELEALYLFLCRLRFFAVEKEGVEEWQAAFNRILRSANATVRSVYGGCLAVDNV